MVTYYDRMANITKADVVAFANKYFGNNYVCVFKRTGESKNTFKVEKPKITPLDINRGEQSAWFQGLGEGALLAPSPRSSWTTPRPSPSATPRTACSSTTSPTRTTTCSRRG